MTTTPKATDRSLNARLDDGKPDWHWIKAEYRVGQLSNRNIARAAGVAESTIRAHAKRDGWERDLSEDVRMKVRSAQSVRTSRAQGADEPQEPLSDKALVEQAAARTLGILAEHRTSIHNARALVDGLVDDLLNNAAARAKAEGKEQAIIIDAACRAVRSLSGALKDLIGLERQALNLDDQEKEPDRPLDYIPLAERVKHYMDQGYKADGKVVPLHGPEGDGAT